MLIQLSGLTQNAEYPQSPTILVVPGDVVPLIQTAKLNNIDPQAWLADVLARLPIIRPNG